MPKKVPVGVVGVTGYTGIELLRLLCKHPHVEIKALVSRQNTGTPYSDLFPAFKGHLDQPCDALNITAISKKVDVIFLCLPHGESMNLAKDFRGQGVRVIDLSADFRIQDPKVYEEWYAAHHQKELLKEAVYGLPELHADAIKKSQLVASPGCYPTSILLALAPLIQNRLIQPDDIICDAKSGTSGAGRSAKVSSLFCEVNESFRPYNIGKHRHTPEVEQELTRLGGDKATILFSPHLVPMDRGILATTYSKPLRKLNTEELTKIYQKFYAKKPFVKVLAAGNFPATKDVRGTNSCHVSVLFEPRTQRIVACSAIDNLTKGASGQAIQSMNLMLKFPETAGLDLVSLVP